MAVSSNTWNGILMVPSLRELLELFRMVIKMGVIRFEHFPDNEAFMVACMCNYFFVARSN